MNTTWEEYNYWEISQEMTLFPPFLDKEVAAFKLCSSCMEENYTPEQLNFEFLKAQFLGEHTPIGCMEFSSKALISTSPASIL